MNPQEIFEQLDMCIQALIKGNITQKQLGLKKAESDYYTCISATENTRLEAEILRTKVAWLRTELKNS